VQLEFLDPGVGDQAKNHNGKKENSKLETAEQILLAYPGIPEDYRSFMTTWLETDGNTIETGTDEWGKKVAAKLAAEEAATAIASAEAEKAVKARIEIAVQNATKKPEDDKKSWADTFPEAAKQLKAQGIFIERMVTLQKAEVQHRVDEVVEEIKALDPDFEIGTALKEASLPVQLESVSGSLASLKRYAPKLESPPVDFMKSDEAMGMKDQAAKELGFESYKAMLESFVPTELN